MEQAWRHELAITTIPAADFAKIIALYILHDDQNQLRRLPLSARNHSTGDLTLCQIYFKFSQRRGFAGGTQDLGLP